MPGVQRVVLRQAPRNSILPAFAFPVEDKLEAVSYSSEFLLHIFPEAVPVNYRPGLNMMIALVINSDTANSKPALFQNIDYVPHGGAAIHSGCYPRLFPFLFHNPPLSPFGMEPAGVGPAGTGPPLIKEGKGGLVPACSVPCPGTGPGTVRNI